MFTVGQAPTSWCSKKHDSVSLSTCEAEYMSACHAACQALWLRSMLREVKLRGSLPVDLMINNKSAISLAKKSSISWQEQTH